MNKRIFALFLCVAMVFVGCSKVDDEIGFAEASTATSQKIKSIENENFAERACANHYCETEVLEDCNDNIPGVIYPKVELLETNGCNIAGFFAVKNSYNFGFRFVTNEGYDGIVNSFVPPLNECPDKFTWEISRLNEGVIYTSNCSDFTTVFYSGIQYWVSLEVQWQTSYGYHSRVSNFTFEMEEQKGNLPCLRLKHLMDLDGDRLAPCGGGGTEMALTM